MAGRPKNNEIRITILKFLYLREKEGRLTKVSDIAKHISKSVKTTSYIVSSMEKEGLVAKDTVGRTSFVRITEKGKHMLEIYSKQGDQETSKQSKGSRRPRTKKKEQKKSNTYSKKSEQKSLGMREAEAQRSFNMDVLRDRFIPRKVRLHDYKVKLYLDILDDDSGERLFPLADNRDVNLIIDRFLSSNVIKKVVKKYWDAVYFSVPLSVDVTLEATTRAVIIHFHSKEFEFSWDVLEKLLGYIYTTVAQVIQYIVTHTPLRVVKIEALNMHLAFVEPKFVDESLPRKLQVSVELNRRARAFNGIMKQRAGMWFDRSFGELERELNDVTLARLYLEMPLRVNTLNRDLEILHRKVDVLAYTTSRIVDILEKLLRPAIAERDFMKSKGVDSFEVSEDIDFA